MGKYTSLALKALQAEPKVWTMPTGPCGQCGGTEFWLFAHAGRACIRCHPLPDGLRVIWEADNGRPAPESWWGRSPALEVAEES